MNSDSNELFSGIKRSISQERKIINDMLSLLLDSEKARTPEENNLVASQFSKLKENLIKANEQLSNNLSEITLTRPLRTNQFIEERTNNKPLPIVNNNYSNYKREKKIDKENSQIKRIEKETLKRIKKKREETIVVKKIKKPSVYIKFSNRFFSKLSLYLMDKEMFKFLKKDLTKANLDVLPVSYISVIFFTTVLSFFASIFIFIFFLFFNITPELPIITLTQGSMLDRFLKVFWIVFAVPTLTFVFMYFYPTLEKKSNENRIEQELPFATIHMAAISGSMIDPSKIFSIIISTREYPYLEKEFTKLLNEINIYGLDLVSALRNSAFNSPSKNLSELFNGIATTITSGGNLPEFFDKRAQNLLFDYRLEREKYTRSAETFMDIYISLVIAAPMILMLLLMMIKISGLGISLSTGTITLIMVLGVAVINILFLTFLQLKQPSG